ncbi:MAG: dihydroneopterin aldolase [Tannerellaceae bacterium]|jgi:dihydroneopterin aldolase|nr:dihydroneopterin aldolase [Tannerellaceae bacterium]
MTAKIELKNMRFYAMHGALPQERTVGHNFIVNLCLRTELGADIRNGNLQSTINYADVFRVVADEMRIPSTLLEQVAIRILDALKKHFTGLTEAEISIAKMNPPIEGADMESAAITLSQTY